MKKEVQYGGQDVLKKRKTVQNGSLVPLRQGKKESWKHPISKDPNRCKMHHFI